MALNKKSLLNIFQNGIEKSKLSGRSWDLANIESLILEEGVGDIWASTNPYEAEYFAVERMNAFYPIPTIVYINKEAVDFKTKTGVGSGYVTKDIPPSAITGIDVMLKVEGKPVWGKLELDGGRLIFTPYSK